jgi:hypothetical protein
MEVITMTCEAYLAIMKIINEIKESIKQSHGKNPLTDKWLDISEVCILLKISKRQLQHYRYNKMLPYSQISGKIYFKAADIDTFLENHYVKSNTKC